MWEWLDDRRESALFGLPNAWMGTDSLSSGRCSLSVMSELDSADDEEAELDVVVVGDFTELGDLFGGSFFVCFCFFVFVGVSGGVWKGY